MLTFTLDPCAINIYEKSQQSSYSARNSDVEVKHLRRSELRVRNWFHRHLGNEGAGIAVDPQLVSVQQ